MSDPHDREPVGQATIDCWRVNYGLDKRTPAEAAQWWSDNLRGLAPSGCVAALGVALDELDALRKDAARYRHLLSDSILGIEQNGCGWSLHMPQGIAPIQSWISTPQWMRQWLLVLHNV